MAFWDVFAILEELAPEAETKVLPPSPEEHDELIARWG